MGVLDKIFSGDGGAGNGVSAKINREAQEINQKIISSEHELRLRQQLGQDVNEWSVRESRQKGLPYDCFFDWEVEMVEESMKAKDNLKGTLRLLTSAQEYLFKNEELDDNFLRSSNIQHATFWVDKLCERAANGSAYARSAVISPYFVIQNNPEISSRINKLTDNHKDEYLSDVLAQVKSNDPRAMVGYAFFNLIGDDAKNAERKALFRKAGNLGLSEAYDQLFYMTINHWESQEGFDIALAAAECDDGEIAYEYQDRLGDAYWYAENWIKEQDKNRALYWYRRAARNGWKSAANTLKRLESEGEI